MGLKNWIIQRKLNKENQNSERLNKTINEVLADAIKENRSLQKLANQRLKLKMIREEQAQALQTIEEVSSDEEQEDDDEQSEEMEESEAFKNLLINSLTQPQKKSTEANADGFLPDLLPNCSTESGKSSQNGLKALFDKIASMPPEKIRMIINLAEKYL